MAKKYKDSKVTPAEYRKDKVSKRQQLTLRRKGKGEAQKVEKPKKDR